MAECVECGETYPDRRRELGYSTCLDCGEVSAQAEAKYRRSCTAPAYNKGPYMYVTTVEQVRDCHRKGG